MDFFSTAEPLRAIRGDTLQQICVYVSGMDISQSSMRMDLEDKFRPGSVVFSKAGTHVTRETDDAKGFRFKLDSPDTSQIEPGVYLVHFVLTDEDDLTYRKLVGTLEILPAPQEVS